MTRETSPCRRGRWACRWCSASPYGDAPASLIFGDGRHAELGTRTLLGRSASCDITLDDSRISREHCAIESGAAGHWLVDLGSGNGCWVGLRRVSRHLLRDGDTVRIGRTRATYLAYLDDEQCRRECPLPADDEAEMATLRALYDHDPSLPLPGQRCPLCQTDLGVTAPDSAPSMAQLRALQRHLGRCPRRPSFALPRPPRAVRQLRAPLRDVEIDALLPAPEQPEAVIRASGLDGAYAVGMIRADGEGTAGAGLGGTAAAHLTHWLGRHSPAAALHRLDQWLVEASHWACPIAVSLLVVRERARSMRYFQAGGMPLLRLRRWGPGIEAVAPTGPSPGQRRSRVSRYRGADLGWPTQETLLMFSPPIGRADGRERALRLLSIIASGRGVLSLGQLIGALRRRGLAEKGSLLQIRLGASHFRAMGSVPIGGGRLWEALDEM